MLVPPDGSLIEPKPKADKKRPIVMKGIEYSKMRLRPIRSIKTSASTVKAKFVAATVKEVSVGIENPSIVKIVAEKYIKEFYHR